jgi:glycosyltransferase involved in cell wall biosynthesis
MSTKRGSWLVLDAHLSAYSFDLFETISSIAAIDVRFVCDRLNELPSFDHEAMSRTPQACLPWKDTSWWRIKRFVADPPPDAVFVYGTRPRIRMNLVLAHLSPATRLFYFADTNIVTLASEPTRSLGRRWACMPFARRATALSLGLTNRLALQSLGFKQVVDVPQYAVDFEALDLAAAEATGRSVRHSDAETLLLVIARLVPAKNLPQFVAALARHPPLASRTRLLIAGEGPDRVALEAIHRRQPHLKLELLGAVSRRCIGELFGVVDALLMPSKSEPWGVAVVEALGMGIPVIATPSVGAAVSLAGATQAIVISESAKPDTLLAAIVHFINHRAALMQAAQSAKPDIRRRYGRLSIARQMVELVDGDS